MLGTYVENSHIYEFSLLYTYRQFFFSRQAFFANSLGKITTAGDQYAALQNDYNAREVFMSFSDHKLFAACTIR
jgi:hypothetical protein